MTKSPSSRRKKNFWSQIETDLLISAVNKYGKSWSVIEKMVPIFKLNNRTQIDLKDKYRNLTTRNKASPLYKIQKKPEKEYVIFTKIGCNYCKKAKDLLTDKNLKYQDIIVTDKNKDLIYKKLDNFTGTYRSFPMVFQNNKFIGGFSELEKYLM